MKKTNNSPTRTGEKTPSSKVPEPLKLAYKLDGLNYRQIVREKKAAVYAVYSPTGALRGYETIIPIVRPSCELGGKSYPLRETYPNSEQGGASLWYFPEREEGTDKPGFRRAFERFIEIL